MSQSVPTLSRKSLIALIAAATLGGSAVTAGIAHYAFGGSGVIVSESGEEYPFTFDPNGNAEFRTDDGQVFRMQLSEGDEGRRLDVEAEGSGTTTVFTTDGRELSPEEVQRILAESKQNDK